MTSLSASYLDTSNGDWCHCLVSSYAFLRHSWRTDWIGLPQLIKYCSEYLKLATSGEGEEVRSLLTVALGIASQIESEKGCGMDTPEPSYHNRLHFADALTTITLQCGLEVQNGIEPNPAWQAALLLIALSHDFRHSGHVNRHSSEIEYASVNHLVPIMKSMKLDDAWIGRICDVILRSDFSLVKENHSRVNGRAFQWDTEWAAVLLNEADIMASASDEFGPALSNSLSTEWEAINFAPYATVATESGRRQFLSTIQFSSYSGKVLSAGIMESI